MEGVKHVPVQTANQQAAGKEEPEFAGGIHASISDEQADQEFEELYKK